MVTNKGIPTGLFAATQLTRAGRLLEATALIQHILRHGSAPAEGAEAPKPKRRRRRRPAAAEAAPTGPPTEPDVSA